jgi:hypothetical protein
MKDIRCKNCGKECILHAKEMCTTCYKKLAWKQKLKECKRCKRNLPHHGKGLCRGCYNFVFKSEYNKAWNQMKNYGINMETYKKITSSCVVCGFEKVVDLHHLDENSKNNSINNLIGLCPNHHKMLHHFNYRREMLNSLKEKGFNPPKDPKLDFQSI